MKNKRIILFALGLFFGLASRPRPVSGGLFSEVSRLPYSGKVSSFSMDCSKKKIGFLLYEKGKGLYYLSSSDSGTTFARPVRLTEKRLLDHAVALSGSGAAAVWFEEAGREIRLCFPEEGPGPASAKTLHVFPVLGAFSPSIVLGPSDGWVAFSENEKGASRIRLIRFDRRGNVLDNRLLYGTGQNFLPQLAVSGNTILAVWNNITGDNEDLYYSYSRDRGRTWSEAANLSMNSYQDRGPRLYSYKGKFYLLWQDNRLGNWNMAYAEFGRGRWGKFTSLTSRLINCWMPQAGFYHDKIFALWLDKSEGEARISMMEKDPYHPVWSEPVRLPSRIGPADSFRLSTSEDFVLLAWLKDQAVSFSRVINDFAPLDIAQKPVSDNGYQFSWKLDRKDADQYALYLSPEKNSRFFLPVLEGGEKTFTFYLKNPSAMRMPLFHIRYQNDIGLLSEVQTVPLSDFARGKKQKRTDWARVETEKIVYNLTEEKLFLKLKYKKGIDQRRILGRLYFQLVNYFGARDDSNKFVRAFHSLNGNIDFNRLIEGDEIYLPAVWGNIFFLVSAGESVETTLRETEERYALKNAGYAYYLVSGDLERVKTRPEAARGDFIVILSGF